MMVRTPPIHAPDIHRYGARMSCMITSRCNLCGRGLLMARRLSAMPAMTSLFFKRLLPERPIFTMDANASACYIVCIKLRPRPARLGWAPGRPGRVPCEFHVSPLCLCLVSHVSLSIIHHNAIRTKKYFWEVSPALRLTVMHLLVRSVVACCRFAITSTV